MRALLVVGTSQLWGGENPCKAREFMCLDLTRSDLSMIINTIFTDQRCLYFRVLSRHLRRRLLIVPPRSLCWAWAEPSDFDLNQFATPPMPSVSAFMNCEFNHPIWCRINLARSRLSWVSSFLHRKSITVWGMQGTCRELKSMIIRMTDYLVPFLSTHSSHEPLKLGAIATSVWGGMWNLGQNPLGYNRSAS